MLSDRLQARQDFVRKREHFQARYQAFFDGIVEYLPPEQVSDVAAQLGSLLDLHAELATAPVLHTLKSAAEVGFAHVAQQQVAAQSSPADRNFEQHEEHERHRDIVRRMGQEDKDDE